MVAEYSITEAVTYRMIVSYQKEKSYNAIAYFTENTSSCFKKKLFKLLWLFDTEHFQSTGRSVTGYEYQAWQMGPVPVELATAMDENHPDPELLKNFNMEITKGKNKSKMISLRSRFPFESKYFSKKQIELLENLSDRFWGSTAEQMEAWTHQPGSPWHRVWMVENRKNVVIPYEYSLDKLPTEQQSIVLGIAREREAFLAAFE